MRATHVDWLCVRGERASLRLAWPVATTALLDGTDGVRTAQVVIENSQWLRLFRRETGEHMERHRHRPHADGIAIGELNRRRCALGSNALVVR
jgi:hypothetical protein